VVEHDWGCEVKYFPFDLVCRVYSMAIFLPFLQKRNKVPRDGNKSHCPPLVTELTRILLMEFLV